MSFNIPQLEPNNFIGFKIYVFCGIVLFESLCTIFTKMYHQQLVDLVQILKSSLQSGLVAVVAYSIYTDVAYASCSVPDKIDSFSKENLIITIMIVSAIGIIHATERIFLNLSPKINDELNIIYPHSKA